MVLIIYNFDNKFSNTKTEKIDKTMTEALLIKFVETTLGTLSKQFKIK